MKKFLVAVAATLALTSAASAGALDDYNAKYLNSKEAKAAYLKQVCNPFSENSQRPSAVQYCEEFKKNGVPDSDIRHGILAVATIAGAGAGAAVVTTPSLIGASAPLKVFGFYPTVLQGAGLGAAAGAVLGAGVGAATSGR